MSLNEQKLPHCHGHLQPGEGQRQLLGQCLNQSPTQALGRKEKGERSHPFCPGLSLGFRESYPPAGKS